MNYIDKIKKNGIIYEIRGNSTGSSDSNESANEAGTSGGVSITYEPNDDGYQVLEKHFGKGAVDTIIWTRPVISNDEGGEISPVKGATKALEEETETVSCPLVYVSDQYNVAFYLGAPFTKISDNEADLPILVLAYGSFLFDTTITFNIVNSRSVEYNFDDLQNKMGVIFQNFAFPLGEEFANYFGTKNNPINIASQNMFPGGELEEGGRSVTKSAEDEEFIPNMQNLAYIMSAVDTISMAPDVATLVDQFVGTFHLNIPGMLTSLAGIYYDAPVEWQPEEE